MGQKLKELIVVNSNERLNLKPILQCPYFYFDPKELYKCSKTLAITKEKLPILDNPSTQVNKLPPNTFPRCVEDTIQLRGVKKTLAVKTM